MRNALIGLLMAATAATPVLAQKDDHGKDRGQHSQQQRQPQPRTQGQRQVGAVHQPQQFQQQRFQGRQFQPQPQQQERNFGARSGGYQGDRGVNRQGFQGENYRRGPAQGNFAPQGNRGVWRGEGARGVGRWDRGWRNGGRYDWQRYRYENRGIFHLGPYYAPYRGYYYNPLEIGIVLDSLFYNRNYWIDPGYYDLPPAPPGAEWVRYYNDVVLVDMDSGQVIDVIHDFFW